MKYLKFLGLFIVALLLVVSCEGATDVLLDLMDGTDKNYFVDNDLVDLPASVQAEYNDTMALIDDSGDKITVSDDNALYEGLVSIINTPSLVNQLNSSATEQSSNAAKQNISDASATLNSALNTYSSNIPDDLESTLQDLVTDLNNIASSGDTLTNGDVLLVAVVESLAEKIEDAASSNDFKGKTISQFMSENSELVDNASAVLAASAKLDGKLSIFDTDFIDDVISGLN